MRHPWLVLAIPALALLASCEDTGDEPGGQPLTADEVAQLNEAAEMLDVSNAPSPPSNIIVP